MEPTEWPKGSHASCGVLRGDSGLLSRPWRKRRSSSRDARGISWFFSNCIVTCGVSFELQWGTQGVSPVAPRKSNLDSSCEGMGGIALESRQGNRASGPVEKGISLSFLSCSKKPWVPSTCDGDLSELLMVPMGSQESCGVGRGLSGLHWGWCNERGLTRVEARTSGFLSISDVDRRVSAELEQESQTPFCVKERNPAFFSCCLQGDSH